MFRGSRVIVVIPAFDEQGKIGRVVRNIDRDVVDTVLVINDGSRDDTEDEARAAGALILRNENTRGVGYGIRSGYRYAMENGFDIAVVMAGNGKDDPSQIPKLLQPIEGNGCDFVMGSRYLDETREFGDMPLYRKVATRLHPWLVGRFCGKKITESTNGFRALRVALLQNPAINLQQRWLERYELEVYLLMQVLRLGYKTTEVPVSKVYPERCLGQTKMRPVSDWWRMLKPVFALGLRLRS